jgi:ATP synthase F1 delta subunit
LIGENLDEKRQKALLDEFFSGVKNGKVVVLEGELPSVDTIEVISALPLTTKEKEVVRNDLISQMAKGKPDVAFRVDTSILGGLIVRAGDRVMDGSVAGQLEAMRQNLK